MRSTKKVLYRIQDPAVRFWFRVYSPHRSLWRTYSASAKHKLVHDHAATVFEEYCRGLYPGSRRYWNGDLEFDLVAPDPEDHGRLLLAEVKWRKLTARERRTTEQRLQQKWSRCSLRSQYPRVRFVILDASVLGRRGQ